MPNDSLTQLTFFNQFTRQNDTFLLSKLLQ